MSTPVLLDYQPPLPFPSLYEWMESESDMIEMTNPECRAPSRFLGVDGSTERDVAIAGFASGWSNHVI
jgi:hypothetical protein